MWYVTWQGRIKTVDGTKSANPYNKAIIWVIVVIITRVLKCRGNWAQVISSSSILLVLSQKGLLISPCLHVLLVCTQVSLFSYLLYCLHYWFILSFLVMSLGIGSIWLLISSVCIVLNIAQVLSLKNHFMFNKICSSS